MHATASYGTILSHKHADPRLIKQAIRRHIFRGNVDAIANLFTHLHRRLRFACSPSNRCPRRRHHPCSSSSFTVASSCHRLHHQLAGDLQAIDMHDILYENTRVIHLGRDIYLQGTCITRGKEDWWRRGRPRGRSVNWSPRRYR